MDKECSQFWWESITGPASIVKKVVEALQDGRYAVLEIPSDLPWRDEMRVMTETALRDSADTEDFMIDIIDVKDTCGDQEPGRFLLKRYSREAAVRDGYRSRKGKTIQDYLIENGVLNNIVVWVKGIPENKTEEWIRFVADCKSHSIRTGLFVMEIQDTKEISLPQDFCVLRYQAMVSTYDVQLLNSLILDDEKNDLTWCSYIATVAATLCRTDAEVSADLVQDCDWKTENPIDRLKEMAQSEEYNRRGADPGSTHVFALCRSGEDERLEKRLWMAQVKVLFPILEMERRKIIEKYDDELNKALQYEHVKQFNKDVIDPYELELGTLDYLMSHRNQSGKYIVYIPDEEDRKMISFLRDCRNHLAHASSCSPEQVGRIIEIAEESGLAQK